jgi:hypothetical protein
MIYDIPPISSTSALMMQAADESPLVANVEKAKYDAAHQIATIKISDAFPFSRKIRNYEGQYVTLFYRGSFTHVQDCPVIVVPLSRVQRDFPNIFKDTVTLHISDVSQELANTIEKAKCLNIDTKTVRAIVNRPSPQHHEIPN